MFVVSAGVARQARRQDFVGRGAGVWTCRFCPPLHPLDPAWRRPCSQAFYWGRSILFYFVACQVQHWMQLSAATSKMRLYFAVCCSEGPLRLCPPPQSTGTFYEGGFAYTAHDTHYCCANSIGHRLFPFHDKQQLILCSYGISVTSKYMTSELVQLLRKLTNTICATVRIACNVYNHSFVKCIRGLGAKDPRDFRLTTLTFHHMNIDRSICSFA